MINRLLDNSVLFVFGRIALLDFRYASNTERRTGPIVPTERATAWACPRAPVKLASASCHQLADAIAAFLLAELLDEVRANIPRRLDPDFAVGTPEVMLEASWASGPAC